MNVIRYLYIRNNYKLLFYVKYFSMVSSDKFYSNEAIVKLKGKRWYLVKIDKYCNNI